MRLVAHRDTGAGLLPPRLGPASAGAAVLLVVAGVTEGLVHGLRTGDLGAQLPRLLGGALVRVPAAWVLAGMAMVLFGAAPAAPAPPGGVGRLPPRRSARPRLRAGPVGDGRLAVHPRAMVRGDEVTATPLLALAGVAAGLAAGGLAAFRRRDVG